MGTIWVGIDDTDSPGGGCTTWAMTEVLRLAREFDVDLLGEPRLVRLNPNIPWKTRGNAALAARFGRGLGRPRSLGQVGGEPIAGYRAGRPLPPDAARPWLDAVWARLVALAPSAPGTDPALVATARRLPARLYWQAVRDVVPVDAVRRALSAAGAYVRTRGDPRGLVGAAAAIAWPGRRATWELLAYRRPARWGTDRRVDRASIGRAQRRFPALFLCEDPRTRRLLVAPHSPCPILFGLRSRTAPAARAALGWVRSEPIDRWILYRTNQGTGDHLVARAVSDLTPYRSAFVRGRVVALPSVGPGGHVRFSLRDRVGDSVTCVAFEPTKTLPAVARALVPGDELRVWGSRGLETGLRLEGIRILRLRRTDPSEAPRCRACDRPAHSLGRHRGFRCPGCRRRWPPERARAKASRALRPGTYHPTPSARRHLAPLGPEPRVSTETF